MGRNRYPAKYQYQKYHNYDSGYYQWHEKSEHCQRNNSYGRYNQEHQRGALEGKYLISHWALIICTPNIEF